MDNNQDNNKNPRNNGNKNRQSLMILLVCILMGLLCMTLFSGMLGGSTSREITYDQFIAKLNNDEVESVEIDSSTVVITPKTEKNQIGSYTYYATITEDDTALTERLDKAGVTFSKKAKIGRASCRERV